MQHYSTPTQSAKALKCPYWMPFWIPSRPRRPSLRKHIRDQGFGVPSTLQLLSGWGSHPVLRRPTGRNMSYRVLVEDAAASVTASTSCLRGSSGLQRNSSRKEEGRQVNLLVHVQGQSSKDSSCKMLQCNPSCYIWSSAVRPNLSYPNRSMHSANKTPALCGSAANRRCYKLTFQIRAQFFGYVKYVNLLDSKPFSTVSRKHPQHVMGEQLWKESAKESIYCGCCVSMFGLVRIPCFMELNHCAIAEVYFCLRSLGDSLKLWTCAGDATVWVTAWTQSSGTCILWGFFVLHTARKEYSFAALLAWLCMPHCGLLISNQLRQPKAPKDFSDQLALAGIPAFCAWNCSNITRGNCKSICRLTTTENPKFLH